MEEEEEGDSIGEEEVRRLEKELSVVQDRFDKSMMEKHGLSSTCEELTVKLKLAKSLLEGLVLLYMYKCICTCNLLEGLSIIVYIYMYMYVYI